MKRYTVVYYTGTQREKTVLDYNSKQEACSAAIRLSKWADIAMVYESGKLSLLYSGGKKL